MFTCFAFLHGRLFFVFDDVRALLTGVTSSSMHIGFLFSVHDFQLTIVMVGRYDELSLS